jgi:hypothetical protein
MGPQDGGGILLLTLRLNARFTMPSNAAGLVTIALRQSIKLLP